MTAYLLYIDPGSGSYLVQVIIAAVLGGWFWIKSYWGRVKIFFGSRDKSKNEEEIKKSDSSNQH